MKISTLQKRVAVFGITAILCVSTRADITMTLGGGDLRYDNGTGLMPSGGLLLLVASTNNNTFSAPTSTSFVNDDDIILAKFSTSSAGIFDQSLSNMKFSEHPGWAQGNYLQLYWYPDLTTSATAPGITSYGFYRSDVVVDESEIWVTPVDGTLTYNLFFVTESQNGSNPDSAGWAKYSTTAVPEPSGALVSTIAAAAIVGVVGVRRLRNVRHRGLARF